MELTKGTDNIFPISSVTPIRALALRVALGSVFDGVALLPGKEALEVDPRGRIRMPKEP